MPAAIAMDEYRRQRKNVRTALILGLVALLSLGVFVYKIWGLG
jgi:hypothetical protein